MTDRLAANVLRGAKNLWIMTPFFKLGGAKGGMRSLSLLQIKHKHMADSHTTAAILFPSAAVYCRQDIIIHIRVTAQAI